MQQLTTVYQKYVTKNPQSVNSPLSKLWEIALPTPLRIDAPAYARAVLGVVILSVRPSVRLSVCHTRGLSQN